MNWFRLIKGLLLSFVFLSGSVYAIFQVYWFFGSPSDYQAVAVSSQDAVAGLKDFGSADAFQPVGTLDINASAALSFETSLRRPGGRPDKVLFEKSGDVSLPIASLTKLMTAVIVLDNYNLSRVITVNAAADAQDSMKQDVKLGDAMPVESFLDMMLVGSSNKSAYVLAELIGANKFVDLMNQKAADLGLENTFFQDPTGLSPKNVSTAGDLVKLTEYILKNYPKIADISKEKEFYVPGFGKIENTDQLLGEVPDIVCSKTGFTTLAKGCLLLVVNNFKNNDYIINVVLGADDRFAEMKKIIKWSGEICN